MDGNLYDVWHITKNGKNPDSFSAHYGQHFKSTASRMDLRKCMKFKVLTKINLIGEIMFLLNLIAIYVWSKI